MLNRYPLWKNLLILLVVLLAFVYSVPNIFPDDEAIQITSTNLALTQSDEETVVTALEAAQIDYFGLESDETSLLVRLNSVDDQLRAKTAIEDALPDG